MGKGKRGGREGMGEREKERGGREEEGIGEREREKMDWGRGRRMGEKEKTGVGGEIF